MRMLKMKYILFAAFLLSAAGVSAQKAERDYIRKGNRLFNDSVFVDAEVNYRKALEVNPKSAVSMYNLGNTLSQQQKFQEAMEQYDSASKIEKDKMKLAHIYHNMGVLFQAGKDYAKAVDAYKMSLRNNPADHETRYNLALAQKMLKDQQNQQDQDQNQDTIVFRSYDNPDNETGVTKLKAVFVNKVKVGSLKIKKEKTEDSDNLTGTYTFQIKFTNVAGMSLEKLDSITTIFTLKEGKSHTISGIPIGTDYEIIEVKPTDGTTLKKVLISNDGTHFKDDTSFKVEKGSVNGTITAETTTVVEFQNNNKPTGNIVVTKQWVKTDGTPITDLKQLPKSIYLQLQRKQKDNEAATWEAVDYSGNISPEKNWVEVTPKYSGSSYVWSYSFMDLERYVNSAAESKVLWIYRVMEVDVEGKEIASGETYTVDGKTYRVTYSMDASTGKTDPTSAGIDLTPASQETDKQPTVNMTVTNTYLEELNLKITKRGKNTTEDLLSGVQFKLEKKNPDGTWFELVGDPKTTVDGIATFEKLSQGTYRLIETKAAEGYNLLSDSILIEINESNQVKWKMEKETDDHWEPITTM